MPHETLPKTPEPPSHTTLPTWARAVDLATVGLLVAALMVGHSGGFYSEAFGVRISARSPDRILALAILVGILRHWRIRHPNLWERFEQFLRTPEWVGVRAPLPT